jgi:signal transduction histidine kinase
MKGVRRLIAQKMERSWREIPHVTTFHPVDATWVEALRKELTEESGTKVSGLAVIARALVDVCRDHPKLNSTYDTDADEIVLRHPVRLDPARHLDGRRFSARPIPLGDEAAGALLADIIDLNPEQREFLSIASHEIKTPLSVIKGYISLLQEGIYGSVPEQQEKVLGSISDQTDRLARMVAESIGLVTALSPQLGYERASAIAQEAQLTGRGAVELVLEQGLLTREQIDAALSPDALAGLRGKPV